MFRILVCGGRDYIDQEHVSRVLDSLHARFGVCTVIHGAATGADSCADTWAKEAGVTIERFPAEWEKFGKSAGIRRNIKMLKESTPDVVLAFPGGRGTAHMVKIAREQKVIVVTCKAEGTQHDQ